VYSTVFQHVRINHPASKYLYPAASLTHGATIAFANRAGDIHFSRRLRKGKIGRAKTNFRVDTIQFLYEIIQRLLQVGEGYIFIHTQPLTRVEEAMCTGRNRLVPVYPSRHNGTEKRIAHVHLPDLYRRCMRTKG